MKTDLQSRPYGRTNESVTVLGLGGGSLSKHGLEEGVATVRAALDLGVGYFDTAPIYSDGASQVVLGAGLDGRSEHFMVATKLGFLHRPADYRSPDALRSQLWENLRALRREQVDVLQIHMVEHACWWRDGAASDELVDLDASYDFADAPVMCVLREAKKNGLCRHIGITADCPDRLAYVLEHVDVDACLVAHNYNMINRRTRERVVPLVRRKEVAFIAAAIFTPGLTEPHAEWLSAPPSWLKPKIQQALTKLYKLHDDCGLSLVELGIRYLLGDSTISTIVVGAANLEEIKQSTEAASRGALPADLHEAIEGLVDTRTS
jgi:D-threo-aldose 1-dehydrogenase